MTIQPLVPTTDSFWIDLRCLVYSIDAKAYSEEEIIYLAENMKAKGQLQEIIVTPFTEEGHADFPLFEVISGIRRVEAAHRLGWERIRAHVRKDLTPFDKADITYSENEHRTDLDPFRQWNVLETMMAERNLTVREFVKVFSGREPRISRYAALAATPAEIRKKLLRYQLSLDHLIQLMRLPAMDRLSIAEECVARGHSAATLKARIDQFLTAQVDSVLASPVSETAAH